ncbi:hypothetical protein [Pseudonocardia zijingensis]|uniref:Uncharacterized protein n=1 Tax=Pseudonocardia zijingensis TaxID=153376 RepID=A0ABN1N8V1_9PSEU
MNSPEEWAAIAAWVGVLVAAVAAVYAGLQARRAKESLRFTRESAEAAKDQAHHARISADASNKSALAAVDQAASARAALELARQERLRADQPSFEIKLSGPKNDRCHVVVRMADGPPGVHATLTWISEYSWPVNSRVAQTEIGFGNGQGQYEMFKNAEVGFDVDVKPNVKKVSVRVIVESIDMADPERTWEYVEIARWEALPPPQVW